MGGCDKWSGVWTKLCMHWGRAKLVTVTKHVLATISTSELCGPDLLTYMGMTEITNKTTIWLVIIRIILLEQNSILPKQSCSCQLCWLLDIGIWPPSNSSIQSIAKDWLEFEYIVWKFIFTSTISILIEFFCLYRWYWKTKNSEPFIYVIYSEKGNFFLPAFWFILCIGQQTTNKRLSRRGLTKTWERLCKYCLAAFLFSHF